jgi:hypothetical protein
MPLNYWKAFHSLATRICLIFYCSNFRIFFILLFYWNIHVWHTFYKCEWKQLNFKIYSLLLAFSPSDFLLNTKWAFVQFCTQCTELDFHSDSSSLKQHSKDRLVTPLWHTIHTLGQPDLNNIQKTDLCYQDLFNFLLFKL